jgi:hypothetical protein
MASIAPPSIAPTQKNSPAPAPRPEKQRSRLNALRHGLTGQAVVLPAEEDSANHRHSQSFLDEYQPKGPTETPLVSRSSAPAGVLTENCPPMGSSFQTTSGLTARASDALIASATSAAVPKMGSFFQITFRRAGRALCVNCLRPTLRCPRGWLRFLKSYVRSQRMLTRCVNRRSHPR